MRIGGRAADSLRTAGEIIPASRFALGAIVVVVDGAVEDGTDAGDAHDISA